MHNFTTLKNVDFAKLATQKIRKLWKVRQIFEMLTNMSTLGIEVFGDRDLAGVPFTACQYSKRPFLSGLFQMNWIYLFSDCFLLYDCSFCVALCELWKIALIFSFHRKLCWWQCHWLTFENNHSVMDQHWQN